MKYSDENLYQLLFGLPHSLRHSRGHGRDIGPRPEGRPRPDFPSPGHIPDTDGNAHGHHHTHAHGRHGGFRPEDWRRPDFSAPEAAPHADGGGDDGGFYCKRGFERCIGCGMCGHAKEYGQRQPGGHHGFRPHPMHDHRPLLARERILRLIGEEEPVSQIRLAELLFIRPQSLSEQLAKLESDGLVIRTKNEDDKRVILVSLSDLGRQRSQEVETARAALASDFLAPLSQEEREQLFLLLQKLLNRD